VGLMPIYTLFLSLERKKILYYVTKRIIIIIIL